MRQVLDKALDFGVLVDTEHRRDLLMRLTKAKGIQTIKRLLSTQLLTQDAWATLLARFEVTMRSTTLRAIRCLRKTHKDFLQEAGIAWCHRSPQIA